MTTLRAQEMEEAKIELRKSIRPGDKVYCTVKHVSRSGMSRVISLAIIDTDCEGKPYLRDITGYASRATGETLDRDRWGLKVGGCGMDMCLATVYNLGRALFPDGFGEESRKLDADYNVTARKRANSPRHAKQMIRAGWAFYGRNGDPSGWDKDGGYALKAV